MKAKNLKKFKLGKTSIVKLNEMVTLKGGYSTWSGSDRVTTTNAMVPCCKNH